MKTPRSIPLAILLLTAALLLGCSDELAGPPPDAAEPETTVVTAVTGRGCHATGTVQLVWKGSAMAPTGAHGDSVRYAEAVFDVHEPDAGAPARGTFRYRVLADSGALHREVTATVEGVAIDPVARKVWFIGRVTADTKGCGGGPGGGHDSGCSGDAGGGCGDEHDDGHDGGCSGDHDEGGCAGGGSGGSGGSGGGCPDGTHEDGGCPDGSHDDGGCPDGTHEDGACPEGSHDTGGSGGPTGATGRGCRVGQVIVGKAHDAGSPGALDDGITWKWFLGDDPDLPSIGDLASWPHLCKKTITGGNLVIHQPGSGNGLSLDSVR